MKYLRFLLIGLMPMWLAGASSELESDDLETKIYKVSFTNKDTAVKAAISFHSNLLESNYEQGYLIMELSKEDMSLLEPHGFTFTRALAFEQKMLDHQQTVKQIIAARKTLKDGGELDLQALPSNFDLAGIPGYSCYQTVEETFAIAEAYADDYPDLASFIDVGDSWKKTNGSGGYDIMVLKITKDNGISDKPILFINSAIHAREYTTAPLSLAFAEYLIEGYGSDADATWILDYNEVHLMLQTNPDGRKYAEQGSYWRKNANTNYCSSRTPGADLNRNFSFFWNAGGGSSGSQCSQTYRGPYPGSEPETQAMESYVRSIFPDLRGPNINDAAPSDLAGMHLDIHSYSELVLWPWGHTNRLAPNASALETLGRRFAYFNGYTPQQSIGLYATDGTTDNVSYGELGVPAYTFELGTSFFQACSTYQNTILPDNLEALIYAAKVVQAPYTLPLGPSVTDLGVSKGGSGLVLKAMATDANINNTNGSVSTQSIAKIEAYIDTPPWVKGAVAQNLELTLDATSSMAAFGSTVLTSSSITPTKHIIYVRAIDSNGDVGPVTATFAEF